ncbi:hypothetical protein PTKIN_Ptkin03bG0164500 [Pterospermum kingtungense]
MWAKRSYRERREGTNGLVAVAIDKDKNSQHALKWAIDHLLQKGHTIILIHVKVKPFSAYPSPLSTLGLNQIPDINGDLPLVCKDPDLQTRELVLPFRCFCTRKDIHCKVVILEETDVAKALIEYITQAAIEVLVVGASTKTGFPRFKEPDIPGMVSKIAPDFCSVYVISKSKISSMRSASSPAPTNSPLRNHLLNQSNLKPTPSKSHILRTNSLRGAVNGSSPEEKEFGQDIKSWAKGKQLSTLGQFGPKNSHLIAAEHAKDVEKKENIYAECIAQLYHMKSLLKKMKSLYEGDEYQN